MKILGCKMARAQNAISRGTSVAFKATFDLNHWRLVSHRLTKAKGVPQYVPLTELDHRMLFAVQYQESDLAE
jgi:predicted kinase